MTADWPSLAYLGTLLEGKCASQVVDAAGGMPYKVRQCRRTGTKTFTDSKGREWKVCGWHFHKWVSRAAYDKKREER